ncbi:MAG TPA: hypothetical protein VIN08_17475 [Ohtaekwangia sp.]|uniref:hypothetical protein n=1 Tax=Ohtaekwangia sp. TaxID=2066019 RepID=UPI002F946E00
MAEVVSFAYKPDDYESEKASNSYLMSLIAVMVGLPLPIVNLLATVFFYLNNRKGTFFVRWHCTQALLSQLMVLAMNSTGLYWTLSIIFGDNSVSNTYIAYLITIVIFNIGEFFVTIYAAVNTRKGKHVHLWFFGPLTDQICKS